MSGTGGFTSIMKSGIGEEEEEQKGPIAPVRRESRTSPMIPIMAVVAGEMDDGYATMAMQMKRQSDQSNKLEELELIELQRKSEPSPKHSPAWWAWYQVEYIIWKKEIQVTMSSTRRELTKNGVYQKRVSDLNQPLKGYLPTMDGVSYIGIKSRLGHATKEIGLCLMEVWNGPLPASDLDFVKEDCRCVFSGETVCSSFASAQSCHKLCNVIFVQFCCQSGRPLRPIIYSQCLLHFLVAWPVMYKPFTACF
jgi:hypothetical protein